MRQIRTLIVDDEFLARERLKKLLSECDDIDIVGMAENGEQAIACIERLEPQLVFLDIRMPVMDGLGFIKGVRADTRYNMTPILVISSETAPELKTKASCLLLLLLKSKDKGPTINSI